MCVRLVGRGGGYLREKLEKAAQVALADSNAGVSDCKIDGMSHRGGAWRNGQDSAASRLRAPLRKVAPAAASLFLTVALPRLKQSARADWLQRVAGS